MHDVLRSKIQNPSQKFHNNFINFEKSQNFQNPFQKVYKNLINLKNPKHFPKTPIFRSKNLKIYEKEGLGHLPSEENLIKDEKSLRKRLGVWEREVLGGEKSREIERDQAKWELKHTDFIYRISLILDKSRGVKRCRDLIRSTDASIE